jgi:hypothetical protein
MEKNMNWKRFTFLAFVSLVVVTLITALGVRARLNTTNEIELAAVGDNRPNSQAREQGPVRMIRFTLFDQSIYPRKQTIHHGLVQLALEDKTGKSQGLIVERVNRGEATRVAEIKAREGHWRGRVLLRLTPGMYRVYDSSLPANSAELTVNP